MKIKSLNLDKKELMHNKELGDHFKSCTRFVEIYREFNSPLNHLFLIHPNEGQCKEIKTLLDEKNGKYFIICLSSEPDKVCQIQEDNIWNISYGIDNPANEKTKKRFESFYREVAEIEEVDNKKVKELIINYLDTEHPISAQDESDVALILLHKALADKNSPWRDDKHFKGYKKKELDRLEGISTTWKNS